MAHPARVATTSRLPPESTTPAMEAYGLRPSRTNKMTLSAMRMAAPTSTIATSRRWRRAEGVRSAIPMRVRGRTPGIALYVPLAWSDARPWQPMATVATSTGLFTADSAIRRVDGEAVLLLGGGRALLMQLAHPAVAQGVADHSGFEADPFARLRGTLDAMTTIVYGTTQQAAQVAARVKEIHRRVGGDAYYATDPGLLLWVHATLVDTALRMHERFLRPLSDRDARQFYDESKILAEVLGVPMRAQPDDLDDFRTYVRDTVASLEVSDAGRQLARKVFHPQVPWFAGPVTEPVMMLAQQITVGLLPRPLREGFGFSWDARRKAALLLAGAAARQVLPRMPAILRRVPMTGFAAKPNLTSPNWRHQSCHGRLSCRQ